LQKDCYQVLPLDEEYPFPGQLQKDCYLDEEYLGLELPEQQVLLAQQELLPLQA
jgi:hypothetical protein